MNTTHATAPLFTRQRHRALYLCIACLSLLVLVATGCGGGDDDDEAAQTQQTEGALWDSQSVESDFETPVVLNDEENPTIPRVTVRMAQMPFNDHSYASIGIKQGWFEDVGITIEPKPQGQIMSPEQVAPALLAKTIDVGTQATVIWYSAMDQSIENKIFTYADIFTGHAFLGNPKHKFKSVRDFMDEGLEFDEALAKAVQQIDGKSYAYSPEVSQRPFQNVVLKAAGLTFEDVESVTLDDAKIVQLATAGRVDVATPTGGAQTVSLLGLGWTPIVTKRDIIEFGDAESIHASTGNDGFAANEDWLNDNHETALRLAGVMYRIIDYKHDHPREAAAIHVPFLNSIAGTNFDIEDGIYLDEVIDPFYDFEEQEDFFVNETSSLYYTKNAQAVIDSNVETGVLKKTHDPDEIIWADDTWRELKALKDLTDELVAETEQELQSNDNAEAAQFLAQAKEHYDARNYLDSARFANAAKLALA